MKALKNREKIFINQNNINIDSAIVTNGHFKLKGIIGEPVHVFLIRQTKSIASEMDYLSIFLEPGLVSLVGNDFLKTAIVLDGNINNDNQETFILIRQNYSFSSPIFC